MRLIDADALPEMEIERFDTTDAFEVKEKGAGRNHMRKIINDAPTIDAVPVSYILKRAMEFGSADMVYSRMVLKELIAKYRADEERKDDEQIH